MAYAEAAGRYSGIHRPQPPRNLGTPDARTLMTPPHPGCSIRENCQEPLEYSVADSANGVGRCPSHAVPRPEW